MKQISLGIADNHPIVLLGIESEIKKHTDIDIRFSADCLNTMLSSLKTHPVDVLLCDYEFYDDATADGLYLLQCVKKASSDTRIIFFSAHCYPCLVTEALRYGAMGFISKRCDDFKHFAVAIRQVSNGNIYIPNSMSNVLLNRFIQKNNKSHIGLEALSKKELGVVRMICNGFSIPDIANRINRSPKTISNQKNAAMRKLGVKNDIELANVMGKLSRSQPNEHN